jgi:predicted unusual protein kinase regulating ubiquinone biosynthesis (AarF/ABC1/UbiB family)
VDHSELDEISLALARGVADRLRVQPELLDLARNNLARWSRQNASSKSLLRCYAEWQDILSRPVEEICARLVAETEEGQRLRQNSPFAGVLSAAEVWEIKARHRHAAAAA